MGTSTDAELFYGYVWQVSFEESEGTAQFEDFEARCEPEPGVA